jgi:hypothetical protein
MSDDAAITRQQTMMSLSDEPDQSESSFSKLFAQCLSAKNGGDDDGPMFWKF